jgi:hypothetical protein
MSEKTSWWRSWEIAMDSNWIEILLMAIVLVGSGLLLVRDAGHLVFGNFNETPLLSTSRFSNILNLGTAIYLVLLAFASRARFMKVGVGLFAISFAGHLAFDYAHASPAVQHNAAITLSVLRQIAYIIFLVATAKWFKSVTRWVPPDQSRRASSQPLA